MTEFFNKLAIKDLWVPLSRPSVGRVREFFGHVSRAGCPYIPPSYWLAFRSTHKLAKATAKASYDDPAGQISRYLIPGVIT